MIDQHAIEDAVVVGLRRQRAELGPFHGEQGARRLPGRIGQAHGVHLLEPRCAPLREVRIIIEGAAGEEVPSDELHQVLHAPLLVRRGRRADDRMEAALHRELLVRRVPDRLMLGITPQGDGGHVAAGDHPRDAIQLDEAGEQAPQQHLLLHGRGEAHPHPAAVLQPRREEVARLPRQVGLGEGELADLAPVDLEQFPGQPLEAHRDRARQGAARLLEWLHVLIEGGLAPGVGMRRVVTRQLEHPLHGEALLQPRLDLLLEDGDLAGARPPRRLAVERLA